MNHGAEINIPAKRTHLNVGDIVVLIINDVKCQLTAAEDGDRVVGYDRIDVKSILVKIVPRNRSGVVLYGRGVRLERYAVGSMNRDPRHAAVHGDKRQSITQSEIVIKIGSDRVLGLVIGLSAPAHYYNAGSFPEAVIVLYLNALKTVLKSYADIAIVLRKKKSVSDSVVFFLQSVEKSENKGR